MNEVAEVLDRYGRFSEDGSEYRITDWRTPRPWINLISSPRAGLAVSQTGSGFSWIDNSQLGAIVRWQQELTEDRSGRFLYLRDTESGLLTSLAPSPCSPAYDSFVCRHGLGYTTFECEISGLATRWTLFVDADETAEMWSVEVENRSGRHRALELAAVLEWNCGTSPAPRREFQKLFLETELVSPGRSERRERTAIVAGNHMWDVGSPRWGHWNRSFPYVSAFAAAQRVDHAEGDKAAFLGRGGDWSRPVALLSPATWPGLFGRHYDPIAALASALELAPGATFRGGFVLATDEDREGALELASRFTTLEVMDASLRNVREGWRARLANHRIATPDAGLNRLANDWLRYQAISARLWGRAGYYQQSGAFGFRDQLQDSQVWLPIEPDRCREQIRLHAGHQFVDGSVVHWWHPVTEQGHVTTMSDDLLWLAFVVASYIKETGDLTVLDDEAPFLDDATPATVAEHVNRAFERVFRRTSPRGLPFIGAGDWNDGLSAMGLEERGESVWLAQFLSLVLADWAVIHRRRGDEVTAARFDRRRQNLIEAVNQFAWDGAWYRRATRDDGRWIGSADCDEGRIFLNAQTWAILADAAPGERAGACLDAVEKHLVSPAGALLLAPAYSRADETIGYITRYAPGMRENGGVYTHAATWAIAAAAKGRRPALVESLLAAINPSNKDPERYWAEPYVLPGNVDGPASPLHRRAGWTWYTGSAAWLPRVIDEWVLGVRPTWEGLLFDPCLPPSWPKAALTRSWRGAELAISIARRRDLAPGAAELRVDGVRFAVPFLSAVERGQRYEIEVHCG
ncbi:MAG: glycosyl transferase family 36 [Thermoanaerobaculia bacterium]